MKRRKWTKMEKLAILQEVEKEGLELTLRKHGIYSSTYYNWRKKFRMEGESGLERQSRRVKDEGYLRQLEDEVTLLKELLADKEMELALKDELLKKKYPWARKKP